MQRFIAKKRDSTWWVFDVWRSSWPVQIPGVGLVASNFRTEEAAANEARRVETILCGGTRVTEPSEK